MLFRILSMFIFYCFVFFAIISLMSIFLNLLHVFWNIVNLFYILFSRSVRVNVNVDKDITQTVRLQSNTTSLELWIIFPVTFLFLLVWCKQRGDKKEKILFLKWMTFLFLTNKNSSIFFHDTRTCTRAEFFEFEFMNICDYFQFSVTRINNDFYSVSKLEYRNLNSYFHLLILFSGDIGINPGPNHQHKLQYLDEWIIFK